MGLKIGLIDVDAESRGKITFPNLSLMKISAWHKQNGDAVEWYSPFSGRYDIVYMSKVFSGEYTNDYDQVVFADKVIRGGSGYALSVKDGQEVYDKSLDPDLPPEIDHIMPDYSIYPQFDAAYGFLTKGCPRGCNFCHTQLMNGPRSHTVGRLDEFYAGQNEIVLLDPNILACRDWEMHFKDLSDSGALVDFSQGLDVRLLTEEKCRWINRLRIKCIHFAWDNPKEDLRDKFNFAKEMIDKLGRWNCTCYILTNYGSTHEEDMMRVDFIRSMGFQPYIMVYRKETAPKITKQLMGYVNNPRIFWTTDFKNYKPSHRKEESYDSMAN